MGFSLLHDAAYEVWFFKDSDSGGDETYWVKVLEEAASSKAVGGISWTAGGDNRGDLLKPFFMESSGWLDLVIHFSFYSWWPLPFVQLLAYTLLIVDDVDTLAGTE